MKKLLSIAIGVVCVGCSTPADSVTERPEWLEPDSASAIAYRMSRDFPMTADSAAQVIAEMYPALAEAYGDKLVEALADARMIETAVIDGETRVFRKSPRNLSLLHPDYNDGWTHRGCGASAQRQAFADSVVRWSQGQLVDGGAHHVKVRFSIDVPGYDWLEGDTLRVWMPYPIESARQSNVQLVSTSHPDYVMSTPEQSVHSTIYFSQPVTVGDTAHFEYVVSLDMSGEYHTPQSIIGGLQPYDTSSPEYAEYTAFEAPHIVRLDSLAHAIVGDETNPYKQSELVYDYIVSRYPWAGAREYSTIPCIPQYVIDRGYGDCGQVALLYISLMRTLGVPARWESGWMLHPGEVNLHDWAEVYFEGIGWVPVDVSFGRYEPAPSEAVACFYSTGIDSHRFACNRGVGRPFYPAKRYLRSESVDSQLGEVECSQGNLFYPGWDQTLEILEQTPIPIITTVSK